MFLENNRLFAYLEIMREKSPNTFDEVLKYSNGLKDLGKIPNKQILDDINQLTDGTTNNGRKEII